LAVRPLLVAAGVLLVIGLGAWVVLGSSLLAVDRVSVQGAGRVPDQEIIRLAAVEPGTPLARVDTDAVAARVDSLLEVADVRVIRRWPHDLLISVKERTPVAVVGQGRTLRLVDAEGVIFDEVSRRPRGMPLVDMNADRADPALLRAALAVLAVLPQRISTQIQTVSAPSPDAVTLALSRDRTVVWGSAEGAARKAAVLTTLIGHPAKVYDVSAPDAPKTRG
jgi:cell division protein FtsQ